MEEPAGQGIIEARNAVTGLVVISDARKILRLVEVDELADEETEASVVIVVEPDCAGGPSGSCNAGLFGYVSEGSVAVVAVENTSPVLGHIQVREAVAIVVADCDALPVTAPCNACFFSYVGEGSVTVVAVERVAQRGSRIVEVTLAAVDEIDVHPSVIVVVEECAASSGRFREVFLI